MKYGLFGLFLVALNSYGQFEREHEISTSTCILKGTLLNPGNTAYTALLISGSGPTDRNGNNVQDQNNSLKLVAEELAEAGISSLRYDKRGVGQSCPGLVKEESLRFDDFVQDAIEAGKSLSRATEIDSLILIGHSQGALVATLAAQELPNTSRLILIAGSGRPANILIEEQMKASSPLAFALAKPYLDSLAGGNKIKVVPPMLSSLFRPEVQPFLISWFRFDPAIEVQKVSIPTLIVNGSHDIQVDIKDAEILFENINQGRMDIIPEMNHVLKRSPAERNLNILTYSNPELPLHPELIPSLLTFIRSY